MTTTKTPSLGDQCKEILSQANWGSVLQKLGREPKDKGEYLTVKCPECGELECSFYPNQSEGNPQFHCSRGNKCGYNNHILAYLNDNEFPQGEQWTLTVKKLADLAGMPLKIANFADTPYTRKGSFQKTNNILDDYWLFLQQRFPGSKAEEYVVSRGLDPRLTPFGFFPSKVQDVLTWAKASGYSKEKLIEYHLIKEKPDKSGYFVFSCGRLAGAFIDQQGNIHNIWGRDLTGKDDPKYLTLHNSELVHNESPYGAEWFKSGTVILVEGYFDVIAARECGIKAVASGTSSIRKVMLESLKGIKQIIIALDHDGAGDKGAFKFLVNQINEENPTIWFTDPKQMKGCKDFAELYQSHGAEAVKTAVEESTLIHRDQALAELLVKINSKNTDDLTNVEREAICVNAYTIDNRLSVDRCPSFERYFWRPLCESIDYDIDAVMGAVENKRERQRKEKILHSIDSMHANASDALSKKDMKAFGKLQVSIANEIQSLEDQSEAIRLLNEAFTREDMKAALSAKAKGVRTGLVIDNEEITLAKEGLTTLVMATSHGKTTIAVCIAINALNIDEELEVIYISFEESLDQIASRLAHRLIDMELSGNSLKTFRDWWSKGSSKYFKGGTPPNGFFEREKMFWKLIDSKRLTVLAPENQSLESVLAIAKAAVVRKPNFKLLIIDYLQLIELPERDRDARHEQLKVICKSLMQFGRNNGIAILCPAQFNRTVEKESDIRITAIGEGGSIERFSDQVICGWNRTFNIPEAQAVKIEILKNRSGRTRGGLLSWDGNTAKVGQLFEKVETKSFGE